MRHILNLLVLLHCATACGADPAATSLPPTQDKAAAVDSGKSQTQVDLGKNTQTNQNHIQSYAVADQKALPSCDSSRDTELAYVRAEKAFYVCDQGQWGVIDIKGEDGKDGTPGKDGIAGVAGKDGAVVTAQAPVTTKPPRTLGVNEFIDTYTGMTWVKSTSNVTFATASLVCSGIWRLPTELDLKLTMARGFIVTGSYIWASSNNMMKRTSPEAPVGAETTDVALAYCVLVE